MKNVWLQNRSRACLLAAAIVGAPLAAPTNSRSRRTPARRLPAASAAADFRRGPPSSARRLHRGGRTSGGSPPPQPAPKIDSGDTAWMLTSSALVLMMTIPGLALFYYGGMVRKKEHPGHPGPELRRPPP